MVVNGSDGLAAVATDSQLVRNDPNVKDEKTASKRELNTQPEKVLVPDLFRASTHRLALGAETLSSLVTGALALDTS
jgi:hypothetical protein